VLMLALFSAGLGSSTQHPLASSLMAHAFAGARSMKAIGTYNFAGDIGKMTIPAIASLLLVMLPWRPVLALFGILGIVAGVVIYILTPRLAGQSATEHSTPVSKGRRVPTVHWIAFPTLTAIAMIDSATRMGFLLFLPFILTAKGASVPTIGIALTLVFAGGAMGKLLCGFIGARIGAIPTILASLFNLWLAARIVSTSGRLKRPWPDLSAIAFPSWVPLLLAAALERVQRSGLPDAGKDRVSQALRATFDHQDRVVASLSENPFKNLDFKSNTPDIATAKTALAAYEHRLASATALVTTDRAALQRIRPDLHGSILTLPERAAIDRDHRRVDAALAGLASARDGLAILEKESAFAAPFLDALAGFLRGQGTICLILALYYASALRLIGLNHGLLIGLVAGLISFIPYLGSLIGLVLSLCVVVLQFWPNWTMIPVVLGIFVAVSPSRTMRWHPILSPRASSSILSG